MKFEAYSNLNLNFVSNFPRIAFESEDDFLNTHGNINQAYAIAYRDCLILEYAKYLGIKNILDVGSDFGHLLALGKYYEISMIGIEPAEFRFSRLVKQGFNCFRQTLEQLLSGDQNVLYQFSQLKNTAISVLNITHISWPDNKLKLQYLLELSRNTEFLFLSIYDHEVLKLEKYGLRLEYRLRLGSKHYNNIEGELNQYGNFVIVNRVVKKILNFFLKTRIPSIQLNTYANNVVCFRCK